MRVLLKNMTYLFRTAILFLIVLHVMVGLAIAAQAANLKSLAIVEGDVLTVGDIFEGVTRNADYVLGAAPKPGQDMTLNARTLYRIANALDLGWRPHSMAEQITIRREATVVDRATIESNLKKAIKNKGIVGNYKLKLNTQDPSFVLPATMAATAEIAQLHYNHQTDYFQATLVAPSADNPVKTMRISGLVERMITVPVLRSTLQNGDVIGENDIQYIDVPEENLQFNVLTDANKMIGMTPRRIAHAGKFILDNMLQRPQLVERGENVVIEFKRGPLSLTAKGRALQSGAKGDVIRIKNLNSSKILDAIVTASNQVRVQ